MEGEGRGHGEMREACCTLPAIPALGEVGAVWQERRCACPCAVRMCLCAVRMWQGGVGEGKDLHSKGPAGHGVVGVAARRGHRCHDDSLSVSVAVTVSVFVVVPVAVSVSVSVSVSLSLSHVCM